MAELTFYTNPNSRGRVARWMLEEVGAPYETVLIDFGTLPGGEDFRRINPMAKVPTLVHRGRVVTECAAICAYLADVFPKAGLAPADDERADYYRWLFFAAGPGEAALVDRMLGFEVAPEQQRMAGYGSLERMVDALALGVSAHDYVAGKRFTAADVYVSSLIGFGLGTGVLPERPAFGPYLARVMSRAAAVRAREIDDALIAKAAATA